MIKAVIFDFDGVLVESLDIKEVAFARLFESEGETVVSSVIEYHRAHGGVSRYDKFRYFYREILKRELSEVRFQELCSRFSELVLEEVVKCPFVPGATEFLNAFAHTLPCYITSATPESELSEILLRRGMTGFFRRVFGAPTSKADAVSAILAETGFMRHEAVYVGDALADYEAAKTNGVNFIARCVQENYMFNAVDCPKLADLTQLHAMLGTFRYA